MTATTRAAVVGTGMRAQLYTEGLARRDHVEVVALCDTNSVRMAHHNRMFAGAGRPPARTYAPEAFAEMLRTERIDTVVVTTVDALHDTYIVPALRAGCRVVTEKPMTTDAQRCRGILDAVEETGGDLSVAFNYRFNPVHELVHRELRGGAVGEIISVHFEWMLDVRHGADYFRRWHRERENSGGLMVHKAGHHFDLVNWWLGARPERVFGVGRLAFYGRENGERTGYRRDYERAHGSPAAAGDPFALHLEDNEGLRTLYLDAEQEDGYFRDRNVFGDGITIEDDMAVLVRYATGASMSYHLTAYSPWEGYRVMFNGTGGRLELEVEESAWQRPSTKLTSAKGALHGDTAQENAGGARILVRPLWQAPREVAIPEFDHAGHGGGDARMMRALFDGEKAADGGGATVATVADGAYALAIGLAANTAFARGDAVDIDDVISIK